MATADWRRPLGAGASSFNCASGALAAVVPALALFSVKDYEHRFTRRRNNTDEALAKVGMHIKRSAKLSMSPSLMRPSGYGELALLPGERFVILNFEMLSSLGLVDS